MGSEMCIRDSAETEEPLAHAINAVAPGVLAEAAAARGIPMIHFLSLIHI